MTDLSIIDGNYRDGAYATSRNNDNIRIKAEITTEGSYIPASNIVNNFGLHIARNKITGYEWVQKFGANNAVGTSVEDVWFAGGTYPWPQTAETVRIKAGGDVNDTAAGTGAQSVIITGLDETFTQVQETLVTAGASASAPSVTTFIRILSAKVVSVGTYTGSNVGDIQIETTSTLAVIANLGAVVGRTQLSQYTIPAGKTGYIQGIEAGVDSNKVVDLYLYERYNADDTTGPTYSTKRILNRFVGVAGTITIQVNSAMILPEKTDVWFAAITSVGTSKVSVNYSIILIDN